MRHLIAATLALCGATDAQNITANGLVHNPLGQAQVVEIDDQLIVTNLSTSGSDGLRTLLTGAESYSVAFTPGTPPPGLNPFIQLTPIGQVNGIEQAIWPISISTTPAGFGVAMDFANVGLQGLRVKAWDGNVLVADTAIEIPQLGEPMISDLYSFGCFVHPVWVMVPPEVPDPPFPPIPGEAWAVFELELPTVITVNSLLGGGSLPVLADKVAIVVEHTAEIGALSESRMVGTGVTDFTICEELVGFQHFDHTAIGDATLQINNGVLTVDGLGSQLEDTGVSIGIDPLIHPTLGNGLEMEFAPLNFLTGPFGPIPSMELQAFGSVQGIESSLGISRLSRIGQVMPLIADFSAIGAPQARVVGLLDGTIVIDTTVPNGQSGVIVVGTTLIDGCGKLPPDPPCFFWNFAAPVPFDVTGPQGPTLVDEIRLLAEGAPAPIEGLSRFNVLGTNLGPIQILDENLLLENAFEDLGGPLPGTNGIPLLVGEGPLAPGSLNTITMSNAARNSVGALFYSFSAGAAPFKGGTLQTVPVAGSLVIIFSGNGTVNLPFAWPDVPQGISIVLQGAIADAGAVQGVALTNAIMGTSN